MSSNLKVELIINNLLEELNKDINVVNKYKAEIKKYLRLDTNPTHTYQIIYSALTEIEHIKETTLIPKEDEILNMAKKSYKEWLEFIKKNHNINSEIFKIK